MEEAFQWCESQRAGLGAAIRHAIDIAVAAVESNPEAYAVMSFPVPRRTPPRQS